ncbi:hypothetical protein PENFLA_c098G01846 [Penicillium flavigenum]|uniref:Uncharacterized protein n=1 Tax=Penicillium flavigenum TaxID=254877 RepID=A0A1V6S8V0_9EURO|nr:hypothetical protein PENFLA_c098G01846 [Penicillium flavigenum]
MLRDYQADANTIDGRSRTPIFYAIRTKNETMIRTLLFDKRADIDWQDHRGQTPLVYAIASNLLSTASLLVDFDPCLNTRDAKDRSAIWYAIALCDENLVQVLLGRGSDIRTPDYKRFSPFSLAIAKKTPGITRLLLLQSDPNSRKALLEDVTIRNRLLRQAVQACLQNVISLLVAQGADPNSRNRDGQSLLHQATKNGDAEVVQQLLAYDEISINATDRQSCTALHIAAEYGCTSVAKCLLAKCTLCLAADAKHTTVALQILAEDHVDVNVAGQISRTALHHTARTGNIPITCVLLANEDLDPNVRDDHQWAPLTYAASNGDLRMVELFLARGDIQVNVQQAPPLFHAAKQGHVEVVRRLLQFDTIDVNQQFWNSSPLCVASEMGHPEVTRLLLEHTTPPDTNLKTYMGDTALSLAAYHGHLAIINLLLEENGLDVAATDKFGDTALCKAARNGHEQVVKRLYRDTRAKCASDVKRAIEAASNCRIALYPEGHLNEEGNFCSCP